MSASKHSDSKFVRWAALAAMAAGIAFVVKVSYIYLFEGDIVDAVTGTLYILGFTLPLFASAGVAAKLASKLPARIGLYLLVLFTHVFFITMLSEGIEALVNVISDVPEYVVIEIPLALVGVAWLVVGYRMWSTATEGRFAVRDAA